MNNGSHAHALAAALRAYFRYRATCGDVTTREGAGARRLAFHPNKPLVYVVNELDSTVTTYRFDAESGRLAPLMILSCRPVTFTGDNRAPGITVDRRGRFL